MFVLVALLFRLVDIVYPCVFISCKWTMKYDKIYVQILGRLGGMLVLGALCSYFRTSKHT